MARNSYFRSAHLKRSFLESLNIMDVYFTLSAEHKCNIVALNGDVTARAWLHPILAHILALNSIGIVTRFH